MKTKAPYLIRIVVEVLVKWIFSVNKSREIHIQGSIFCCFFKKPWSLGVGSISTSYGVTLIEIVVFYKS